MVVRTDTYGAYIWNGTAVAAARYFNEYAGRICAQATMLITKASTKSKLLRAIQTSVHDV